MRVAAFGRTRWLYDAILKLVEGGHEIVFVGTCRAAPEYSVREHDFEALAGTLGVAYHFGTDLAAADMPPADVAISANWLTLVPDAVLRRFPHGVLNAHPGDLPRYRGNAAPNWAIIAGEPEVAAVVHRMTTELDAGPILARRTLALHDDTYVTAVYEWLDRVFPELFAAAVDALATGRAAPKAQSAEAGDSLRGFPRLPRDSELRWTMPAVDLARLVRASSEPFAGAFSWIGGEKVVVWRATSEPIPYPWLGTPGQVLERRADGGVAVLTGAGALVLREIEIGRRRARAAELIRSTRTRLGLDVGSAIADLEARIRSLEQRN